MSRRLPIFICDVEWIRWMNKSLFVVSVRVVPRARHESHLGYCPLSFFLLGVGGKNLFILFV